MTSVPIGKRKYHEQSNGTKVNKRTEEINGWIIEERIHIMSKKISDHVTNLLVIYKWLTYLIIFSFLLLFFSIRTKFCTNNLSGHHTFSWLKSSGGDYFLLEEMYPNQDRRTNQEDKGPLWESPGKSTTEDKHPWSPIRRMSHCGRVIKTSFHSKCWRHLQKDMSDCPFLRYWRT